MSTYGTIEEDIDWNALFLQRFQDCADLTIQDIADKQMTLYYFDHLLDKSQYHELVSRFFEDASTTVGLQRLIHVWNEVEGQTPEQILQTLEEAVLDGELGGIYCGKIYRISAGSPDSRAIESSNREAIITGPHDAFVEQSTTNISLIRRRIRSHSLKVHKFDVGRYQPVIAYLLYLEGTAHPPVVDEAITRLSKLKLKQALDGNVIAKRIEDNSYSIFPQWLGTERPDVVSNHLIHGKVAIITSESPTVIIAPARLTDFFAVSGDAYERWHFSLFIRILRFVAFALSLVFSAFYVAVTTYHYQLVPPSLLQTIVESRLRVPFEPMVEALLMEGVIELLREAGARLPTKIAQTIGIVGGLVIGQAVVQAGLASNVLIVAVAASALSSFIVPNYTMETSMRILRFVSIILAGYLGYFGIFLFIALFVTHVCHLRTLKQEYVLLDNLFQFAFLSKEKLPHTVADSSTSPKGESDS
ncbi:spore germination protein [Paenibacillus sp. ACRRX]|uniref:spore germination protein n=1 Tax=unclassified Paenibacillus TaxID=185978 RepID=UPI001EF5104B|nr:MULTISPECIES: spore germination protein [unclassified Paenibacillus]MCG7406006.1 spore germination protein [Paenibacillus sp. ACRRX]MDK8182459.1 spore germination protein [Paenibacillus sp. UMB4589-SE434]